MLESLRRGRRWGSAAIVIMVGGVFVLYLGLGGPMQCAQSSGNAWVRVADRQYYRNDYYRVLERHQDNLQQSLGDAYDPAAAGDWLSRMAQGSLVNQAILAGEAEGLGLGASLEEERDYIRSIPGIVDDEGRLNRDSYEYWYQREFGTEDAMREALRDDLLSQKMRRLVWNLAYVSPAEARDAVRYGSDEVRIAYVALEEQPTLDLDAIGEDEVAAFLATSMSQVSARYEERSDQFVEDEQVRARHILAGIDPGASEAAESEARGRIDEARARIEAGEAFEDVALEVSQDDGTRERGGDLGFFARGQMTPPFEEAAFAAQPGELLGPVRSPFGFHLIQVEERKDGGTRPLEEVQEDLARELLAEERAGAGARQQAEALRTAVNEGQSLEQAAREAGLTLERTPWLRRRPDGFVAGLGASLPLQDTAFALSLDAPSSPRIFTVQGKLALIQLLERRGPEDEELDLAVAQQREALLAERRNQLLAQWVDSRRGQLANEGLLYINQQAFAEETR